MPVGAGGGEALRRIEAALAADDPALAELFHRWRQRPGADPGDADYGPVDRWTGLVLLLGLASLAVGPVATVVLLVLAGPVYLLAMRARRAEAR
jgi:hypothetical protein